MVVVKQLKLKRKSQTNQLLNKFNIGARFLLCVIDIFNKYAWVIPLGDKKDTAITNVFQKILDESYPKPNKIWVEKGS